MVDAEQRIGQFCGSQGQIVAIDLRKDLVYDYDRHAKQMGYRNAKEYKKAAIVFANRINLARFRSGVDDEGFTYKWDPVDRLLVIVDEKGYIHAFYQYEKFSFTVYGKEISIHA